MALPSAELQATLAAGCVETGGEGGHERIRVRDVEGGNELLLCGVGVEADGDVVAYGALVEGWFLLDEGDGGAI